MSSFIMKRKPRKNQKVPKATKAYVNRAVVANNDKFQTDEIGGSGVDDTALIFSLTKPLIVDQPEAKAIKGLSLTARVRVAPSHNNGVYRMIIFKWKPDVTYHAPVAIDILQVEDVTSPYVLQDRRKNFSILYDKTFAHGAENGSTNIGQTSPQRYHTINLRRGLGESQFNQVIQPPTGDGANQLHFLVIGTTPSGSITKPTAYWHFRNTYLLV